MTPEDYLRKLLEATSHKDDLWLERGSESGSAIDWARHDAYDDVAQNIWWYLNGEQDKAIATLNEWMEEPYE